MYGSFAGVHTEEKYAGESPALPGYPYRTPYGVALHLMTLLCILFREKVS
jgi:hypothetical protein